MKAWNFQIKNSPKEISRKLESSLSGANRFALNIDYDKAGLIKFKLRKRLLLPFEINTQNNIIVHGKIFKAATHNESGVEVSFSQHPLAKLLMYGHIILGLGFLAALILEASTNSYMLIVGGLLLAIGILLGLHLKKNFDKNAQEYVILISKILDV